MAPVTFDPDDDPQDGDPEFEVDTPSGSIMPVGSAAEKLFYERLRDRIHGEFEFTAASDMADLDQVLNLELTMWRLQRQLTRNTDLHGRPLLPIDQGRLQKSLLDVQAALAKAKNDLGISKAARDKANDGETVAAYLDNLRARALEFGVHRNAQAQLAIALLQEVISISDTWLRSNELERYHLGHQSAEDVLTWIRSGIREQFDQLDIDFIQSNQKYWIQEL